MQVLMERVEITSNVLEMITKGKRKEKQLYLHLIICLLFQDIKWKKKKGHRKENKLEKDMIFKLLVDKKK